MSEKEKVHQNHRERMRTRFDTEGLQNFHDHETLELLLYYVHAQGDVNPIAHRLLNQFGSLHQVLEASPQQLMTVKGVGESTARLLHLMFEIGMRYCQDSAQYRYGKHELDSTEKIAHYMAPQFVGRKAETAAVACLDTRLRPICCQFLGQGTVSANEVVVRQIAEIAMGNHAAAVVLMHNHPRGRASASGADFETTKQLYDSLHALSVELLDHIILGDGEYISMRDYGIIPL